MFDYEGRIAMSNLILPALFGGLWGWLIVRAFEDHNLDFQVLFPRICAIIVAIQIVACVVIASSKIDFEMKLFTVAVIASICVPLVFYAAEQLLVSTRERKFSCC